MTIRELFDLAGAYPGVLLGLVLIAPVAAWVMSLCHGREAGTASPWKYAYSGVVYLACVPGMFAAVVTGYALFFGRENLLDVNFLAYLLPVASMVVTLMLIGRRVGFAGLPGLGRLWGLMVLLGVSFGLALAIQKTSIWLFFGGSIFILFGLAAFAFALLGWASYMLFRRSGEPERKPPEFPM